MCAMSIPGTALHDLRYVHERPPGQAILQQRWSDLAFLHWPVEPHAVQRLLPRGLDLETFDGAAWIGATPFRVSRMRPALFPALPWVGDGLELNLRTYVRAGDVPGVWFFSLDATNPLAVLSARVGFHLPYFFASIDLERKGATRHFHAMDHGQVHIHYEELGSGSQRPLEGCGAIDGFEHGTIIREVLV